MAWDPETYLAFENERTRPAAELLLRVPAADPARVADFGCGPGNSTALLARRWPLSDLEGIDNSPEMLDRARGSDFPARWTPGDLSHWSPEKPYDVIFSNATLQWLGDYAKLLPRLMSFLSASGYLAFQVPRNFEAPSHALMRAVAADGPWAAKLAAVRRMSTPTPEECFTILEPHASTIDIWETEYLHVLSGEDAVYRWVSGTGLRPYVDSLEGVEREGFVDEYKMRLREAYPMRASGKTLLAFRRLFCVARR
jgi:trans-aconitate 2-methyltransferase